MHFLDRLSLGKLFPEIATGLFMILFCIATVVPASCGGNSETNTSPLSHRGTGTAAASTIGQLTAQSQPHFTQTYFNEQFNIALDYPEGCSLSKKRGFLRNTMIVKISCSMDENIEWVSANLVTDNFMPGRDFKEIVEYILGFGLSADSDSGSTYLTPFIFEEFTNTEGMQGYIVVFSIVSESYTKGNINTETSPRKAVVYDLSGNNMTNLRAVFFTGSSNYIRQIADTFLTLK